jgi:5-methylcytosine-specific restriction endonuclease McrA
VKVKLREGAEPPAIGKRMGRPPIFTPEERAVRDVEKRRERDRERLKQLTDEQRAKRREADARYKKSLPKTAELKAKQCEYTRQFRARKTASMTEAERELERAKKRAYYAAHPPSESQLSARRQCSKEWYAANKERAAELRAAWLSANPEQMRIYAQNRRARKRAQAGVVSVDIVDRLMKLQCGKCAACRLPLGGDKELDHITPLAAGGEHADQNLQLLCRPCNRRKGTKDPVTFMQEKGLLL